MAERPALPEPWRRAESKSHPGRFFYFNRETGEKSWAAPAAPAAASRKRARSAEPGGEPPEASADPPSRKRVNPGDGAPCHALHLLVKHAGSRNPSSWRDKAITITKAEARRVLQAQRGAILAAGARAGGGAPALEAAFRRHAAQRSDCSSAARGGCLGFFSFPRMQKAFSEAAFALRPTELSGIVDGDSGLHIIYRVA